MDIHQFAATRQDAAPAVDGTPVKYLDFSETNLAYYNRADRSRRHDGIITIRDFVRMIQSDPIVANAIAKIRALLPIEAAAQSSYNAALDAADGDLDHPDVVNAAAVLKDAQDKKAAAKAGNLIAVTFAGIPVTKDGRRKSAFPEIHTGLYQADFDKRPADAGGGHLDPAEAETLRNEVGKLVNCAFAYVSPSYGVKAALAGPPPVDSTTAAQHAAWEAVVMPAAQLLGYPVDKSPKGVNSLCFVGSDPNAILRTNVRRINIDVAPKTPPPPAPKAAKSRQSKGAPADPNDPPVHEVLDAIGAMIGPPGSNTREILTHVIPAMRKAGIWSDSDIAARVTQWRSGESGWDAAKISGFSFDQIHDGIGALRNIADPTRAARKAAEWEEKKARRNAGNGNTPPDAAASDDSGGDSGRIHWVMTGGKDPKPKDGSTLNAVKCLTEMDYAGEFKYNLWTRRVEYRGSQFKDQREIPIITVAIEKEYGSWGYTPGKEALLAAVRAVAHDSEYHPLQDAIKAIKWDGIHRLDYFGHYVYGLPKDDILGNKSAALIVRGMVARIFKPGTKVAYIPILRSDKQGVGKGESLKELAGEGNFAQGIQFGAFDFTKRVQERGRGKCVIEIGEISSLDAAKLAQAKTLATDTSTNDRDAYARDAHDQPFTFIPVGTTNDKKFLSDLTGNRRHPVIDVRGPVNLQWLRDNRDQLLAEAYQEFLRGDFAGIDGVALPPDMWAAASEDSDRYQVDDPYEIWVGGYLADRAGAAAEQAAGGDPEVDGRLLLEAAKAAFNPLNPNRLFEAMRSAGWESSRPRRNGILVRIWKPIA